ncbi:hypothetical protein ANTRET_LOCUS10750 [Anthophora retusa]
MFCVLQRRVSSRGLCQRVARFKGCHALRFALMNQQAFMVVLFSYVTKFIGTASVLLHVTSDLWRLVLEAGQLGRAKLTSFFPAIKADAKVTRETTTGKSHRGSCL